eukprot:UN23677
MLYKCTLKIDNIDLPEQNFTISGYIEAYWKDPNCKSVDDIVPRSAPVPWNDMFHNATHEEFLSDPHHEFLKDPRSGDQIIWGIYQVQATCSENFELNSFPFDRQVLNIKTAIDTQAFEILRERPKWIPKHKHHTGNEPHQVLRTLIGEKLQGLYDMESPIVDFDTDEDSLILWRLRVQRKFSYYATNVCLPLFLILIGAIPAVAIDITEVADRLAHTGTMFLCAVAFQYTVSSMLPAGGGLTVMDIYILTGFTALAC